MKPKKTNNRYTHETDSNSRTRYSALLRFLTLALSTLALITILFISFHSEHTTLSIAAPSFLPNKSEVTVKLKAYSAERTSDLLYTDSGNARVENGILSYTWKIPDEYAQRDTYTELCVESEASASDGQAGSWCSLSPDSAPADSTPYQSVTCAYYIPTNSRGLLADLFNWNELDERQKIGCLDPKTSTDFVSYIQAHAAISQSLEQSLSIDGGSALVPAPGSDNNTTLTTQEIHDIVQDIIAGQLAFYVGPKGEKGDIGETGPPGPQGDKGDQGDKGETGAKGDPGEKGETGDQGEKGNTGEKGDKGDSGEKGEKGDQGEKGDTGDPGVIAVSGGGLTLSSQTLSLTACEEGQILKYSGGVWACATDLDTDTTYDLSGYLQLADLQSAIDGLTPGYYTKTQVDTLIANATITLDDIFPVQNANGDTVFNVDIINGQVAIGSGSTDDQIPFALILDSFGDTTGTDPTTLAINGAMYYNTDMKKFRCYEDGAWKNCISDNDSSANNPTITVNYIPPDPTGNITLGAHDVGTYTDSEIDQKIDQELTFEYLHPPITKPATEITVQNQPVTNPTVIWGNTGATIGQYYYSFAGTDGVGRSSNSYKYDLLTGQSTQISSYPAGTIEYPAVATDGTFIYTLTGGDGGPSKTNAYRYDPITDTYMTLQSTPYGVNMGSTVYHNGKVYIIGGRTTSLASDNTRNVIVYDISTNTYTTATNILPVALSHVNTKLIGDKVYIMGGINSSDAIVNTTYILDLSQPTLTAVTPLADMPVGRSYGAVTYRDNKIYYIYGRDTMSTTSDAIFAYIISSDSWETITYSGTPTPKSNAGFAEYGDNVWMFGGYSGTGGLDSINTITFQDLTTVRPIAYLKVGERYNLTADTHTDVPVKDSDGNTYPANTTIPAGTEIIAQQDTRVYLDENLTTEGSWIRRGGAGGPIQIGVIAPTLWTDDIVKKNGETWLKLNGQTVDPANYPALASYLTAPNQYLVPVMTDNTTPSPFEASCSSVWAVTYDCHYAFQRGTNTSTPGDAWSAASGTFPDGTGHEWLQIKLGSMPRVDAYQISGRNGITFGQAQAIDWVLEGSFNSTDWDVIDTQVGVTWDGSELKTFDLSMPAHYFYYRITITRADIANFSTVQIGQFNLKQTKHILPNYGTNPAGQYYYIKADGYTNNGYTLGDNTTTIYNFGEGLVLDTTTNTVSLATAYLPKSALTCTDDQVVIGTSTIGTISCTDIQDITTADQFTPNSNLITANTLATVLDNYYTKTEIDSLIASAGTTIGGYATPDYANQEPTNRMPTNGSSWTVDRDGFVFVSIGMNTGTNASLYINDSYIMSAFNVTGAVDRQTQILPVKKGDIIRHAQISGTFLDLFVQFIPPLAVIPPSADMINRPDKWTPGVEYDFGDGLYGQRFTGNIVQAANTANLTDLTTIPNAHIIASGGWWHPGGSSRASANGTALIPGSNDQISYVASIYFGGGSNVIRFSTQSNLARTGTTDNSYDVWIKYTK